MRSAYFTPALFAPAALNGYPGRSAREKLRMCVSPSGRAMCCGWCFGARRGVIDSVDRVEQLYRQILRHGEAIGWSECGMTPHLTGALIAVPSTTARPGCGRPSSLTMYCRWKRCCGSYANPVEAQTATSSRGVFGWTPLPISLCGQVGSV